jgi:tRNA(Ile)-lysidine synthase
VNIPWLEHASRQKKLMVGVSGGLDSTALLYLLKAEGFKKVVVCHLNHELRGNESSGDAKFVKQLGRRLGYEVLSEKVNLLAQMRLTGESLETAGRTARHAYFAKCGKEQRCGLLLLAHHADDQAETILWNLVRGSLGCRGMSEIQAIKMAGRTMTIIRPLLGVRKVELAEWMNGQDFNWREDATNKVNDVVRNRLRNEALPLLDAIANRDVTPALLRAAELDGEWRELLAWSVTAVAATDPQGRLHTGVMKNLPSVLSRAVIANYLKKKQIENVDWRLLDCCVDLLDVDKPASVNLPGGKRLRRKAGRIFIES